ncbi:hypothetical protein ACFL0C_00005, partial [Patescibacteria group bacterium]
ADEIYYVRDGVVYPTKEEAIKADMLEWYLLNPNEEIGKEIRGIPIGSVKSPAWFTIAGLLFFSGIVGFFLLWDFVRRRRELKAQLAHAASQVGSAAKRTPTDIEVLDNLGAATRKSVGFTLKTVFNLVFWGAVVFMVLNMKTDMTYLLIGIGMVAAYILFQFIWGITFWKRHGGSQAMVKSILDSDNKDKS